MQAGQGNGMESGKKCVCVGGGELDKKGITERERGVDNVG